MLPKNRSIPLASWSAKISSILSRLEVCAENPAGVAPSTPSVATTPAAIFNESARSVVDSNASPFSCPICPLRVLFPVANAVAAAALSVGKAFNE